MQPQVEQTRIAQDFFEKVNARYMAAACDAGFLPMTTEVSADIQRTRLVVAYQRGQALGMVSVSWLFIAGTSIQISIQTKIGKQDSIFTLHVPKSRGQDVEDLAVHIVQRELKSVQEIVDRYSDDAPVETQQDHVLVPVPKNSAAIQVEFVAPKPKKISGIDDPNDGIEPSAYDMLPPHMD